MGGRGASSGMSKWKAREGSPYGSQYRSLLTVGNVKFVEPRVAKPEPLMETMTKGRIYALVSHDRVKSIIFFDDDGKRSKQIDLTPHKGLVPHAHHGYEHDEFSKDGQPTSLTAEENRIVASVLKAWDNRAGKQ